MFDTSEQQFLYHLGIGINYYWKFYPSIQVSDFILHPTIFYIIMLLFVALNIYYGYLNVSFFPSLYFFCLVALYIIIGFFPQASLRWVHNSHHSINHRLVDLHSSSAVVIHFLYVGVMNELRTNEQILPLKSHYNWSCWSI